ncbi:MAG: methyltransferase domain-containing protein, partial [Candidatus Acidiferrum sp.]
VNQVEQVLAHTSGLILDIGANTCGESEYLTTRGYSIIATDINEVALGLSKERCAKFGRTAPRYIACDGHRLPLQNESVQFAIFNESLHHMEDARKVLKEVHRVLAPGGKVFMYEPYAYNPYRRLSEVRDRFLGTIEKSFGEGQLKRLLSEAGMTTVSIRRHTCPPSKWKSDVMGNIHRSLKHIYFWASRILPSVFGNLVAVAEKPGEPAAAGGPALPASNVSFESILRCPVTGGRLAKLDNDIGYLSLDPAFRGLYRVYQGIPVLIREEAQTLDTNSWEVLTGIRQYTTH